MNTKSARQNTYSSTKDFFLFHFDTQNSLKIECGTMDPSTLNEHNFGDVVDKHKLFNFQNGRS